MESYSYLLVLAIILLSTKMFGVASAHVHMPQVVGALVAGIILGPSGFGVLQSSDFVVKTAEIGVIMLMFTAGIDTDLDELKHSGLKACVIALMGVFVPLVFCGALYFFFFFESFTSYNVLRAAFVGSVFSATSVSITVETLNEMGKLKTQTGTTLLSAALIDDIIGIVVLSVLSGLSSSEGAGGQVLIVLGKILLFFVFTIICAVIFHKVFSMLAENYWHHRRVAILALSFCFAMAYCAETFFGVADITGAYFAGLILCNITKSRHFIARKFTISSYMLFTPVFFASVGMKVNLKTMTSSIIVFAVVLAIFAIMTKIIGCGIGAKVCGFTGHQSLVIGIGMVARSEVALMVAQKGINVGMIDPKILPAIVLSVVCSALITPVLLKLTIPRGPELP